MYKKSTKFCRCNSQSYTDILISSYATTKLISTKNSLNELALICGVGREQ